MSAKGRGNSEMKDADKTKTGRPRIFESVEQMQVAIDAYFKRCDETIIKKQHVTGKGVTIVETPTPYTMAGLARALNMDRKTLNNYAHRDEFFPAITRARDRIHEQNVTHAMVGCHDSRIAALNLAANYGYSTKHDIQGSGTLMVEVVNYSEGKE